MKTHYLKVQWDNHFTYYETQLKTSDLFGSHYVARDQSGIKYYQQKTKIDQCIKMGTVSLSPGAIMNSLVQSIRDGVVVETLYEMKLITKSEWDLEKLKSKMEKHITN